MNTKIKIIGFTGKAGAPPIQSHGVKRNKQAKYVAPTTPVQDPNAAINSGGTGGTPGVTRIRVVRSYADKNQVVSRLVLINIDPTTKAEVVVDDSTFWILENPWLNNQQAVIPTKQASCIPLGFYNASILPGNTRGKVVFARGFSDGKGGHKPITSNGVTRTDILWHQGGNTKWDGVGSPWSIGCLLFATSDIIKNKDNNGFFYQTAKSGKAINTGKVSNDARDRFFDFIASKMNLKGSDDFDFEVVVAGTGNATSYPKLNIHLPANDKYFG